MNKNDLHDLIQITAEEHYERFIKDGQRPYRQHSNKKLQPHLDTDGKEEPIDRTRRDEN